jgi:bifunctional UDP-N-acetylglucosamine pyrophosphorylase/glucosamine-1-phosphate N-acetyltransferase
MQALKECSITEVFAVVGYKKDMVRSAIGNGDRYGVHVQYLDQPHWTGTASALKVAFEALGEEPFLAVYGDLWLNAAAIREVVEKSEACTRVMGVVELADPTEYGVVQLQGDRLTRVTEKPRSHRVTRGWVNTGVYVLDGEVFRAIKSTGLSKRAEYEVTSSLQRVIDEGHEVKAATIYREDWMDVGRPWDLLEANERSLAVLRSQVKGSVEQGAVLKGPVLLDERSLIKSGCYIEGPAYVGKDCTVGPNSRIRPNTSLQDGVVVGTSCEVKNSIVMRGTRIPHLSYVGDSIIGESCNLGAGTITANIRFDEQPLKMRVKGRLVVTGRKKLGAILGDRVQTGINVSILPGVRIGPGSWIGPGVVVSSDVQSGQLLTTRQQVTKKRIREPQTPRPTQPDD